MSLSEGAQRGKNHESSGEDTSSDSDGMEIDRASSDSDSPEEKADFHSLDEEEELQRDHEEDAKQIADLLEQVRLRPFEYDLHTKLITLAKLCGSQDALGEARQRMSELFPLTEQIWKAWLEDEVTAKDRENRVEMSRINQLYERSVRDYLSVDLWLDYAMFNLEGFSTEAAVVPVRNIFERAITAVGLHVTKGSILWSSYLEIEKGFLSSLHSQFRDSPTAEMEASIVKQTDRIKGLFKRQLSLPLIGMDQEWEEYRVFVENKVDQVTEQLFKTAMAKLNKILPFEKKLERSDDNEKYKIFMAYIEHELLEKEPSRAHGLFERAIVLYCLSPDLWLRYLDFLDYQLKSEALSLDAHDRSIRNLPWIFELWPSYLRALELYGKDHHVITDLLEKAFSSGCSMPSNFVDLWTYFLHYLRRNHTLLTQDELRINFERAMKDVAEKGVDPDHRVSRYWARVECELWGGIDKARKLWTDVMKNHQRESRFWLEYFYMERRFGDVNCCRSLLKKAMLRNLDNVELIAQTWMDFEADVGTLQNWVDAYCVCKDSLKRAADRLEKNTVTNRRGPLLPKKNARPHETLRHLKAISSERAEKKAAVVEKRKDRSDEKPSPSEIPSVDADGFKVPALPLHPVPKKQKVAPVLSNGQPSEKQLQLPVVEPEGDKQERTVFLSNLNYDSSEESVWNMFSKIGDVRDIRFAKDIKGRSRGFCFVEFLKAEDAKRALQHDRDLLDGRPVYVSKDGQRESHFKGTPGQEKNKLFIRGLQTKVTKEELVKLFSPFGTLKDARIVTHKNGTSKGIAFVEFETPEIAQKAMAEMQGKEVQGKPMIIAISNPPAVKASKTPVDSFRPSRPVIAPVPDGQRKSRSHVDLLPRSLLRKQAEDAMAASVAEKPGNSVPEDRTSTVKKSNDDFRSLFKK